MSSKSSSKAVTFPGGIHPDYDGKDLTRECAIVEAPLLDQYQVIIHQNIGAPPKAIVKFGDEVKKGQVIAEAGGFVSVPLHAPTSGKIAKAADVPGPMGINVPAIIIDADGKGCAELRSVFLRHRVQSQFVGAFFRQRETNQPASVSRHERDDFRSDLFRCDSQVAFILATGIVHDNDHLPLAEIFDDFFDRCERHGGIPY